MKVTVTETAIRNTIREMLAAEDQVPAANYEQSVDLGHTPIEPIQNSGFEQLGPPTEDENYIPSNSAELANAAGKLLSRAAEGDVPKLYKAIRKAVYQLGTPYYDESQPVDDTMFGEPEETPEEGNVVFDEVDDDAAEGDEGESSIDTEEEDSKSPEDQADELEGEPEDEPSEEDEEDEAKEINELKRLQFLTSLIFENEENEENEEDQVDKEREFGLNKKDRLEPHELERIGALADKMAKKNNLGPDDTVYIRTDMGRSKDATIPGADNDIVNSKLDAEMSSSQGLGGDFDVEGDSPARTAGGKLDQRYSSSSSNVKSYGKEYKDWSFDQDIEAKRKLKTHNLFDMQDVPNGNKSLEGQVSTDVISKSALKVNNIALSKLAKELFPNKVDDIVDALESGNNLDTELSPDEVIKLYDEFDSRGLGISVDSLKTQNFSQQDKLQKILAAAGEGFDSSRNLDQVDMKSKAAQDIDAKFALRRQLFTLFLGTDKLNMALADAIENPPNQKIGSSLELAKEKFKENNPDATFESEEEQLELLDLIGNDTNPNEKENFRSSIVVPVLDYSMSKQGWSGKHLTKDDPLARPHTTRETFLANLRDAENAIEARGDLAASQALKKIFGTAQPGMKKSILSWRLPKGEELRDLDMSQDDSSAPPGIKVDTEDSISLSKGVNKGRKRGVFVRKNR